MNIKRTAILGLPGVAIVLLAFAPKGRISPVPVAFAQSNEDLPSSVCVPVGGALMTNIGAIGGVTNLGPVFGDLAGSVAATILGQNADGSYNVQHYFVTAAGDTLTVKVAVLRPTYPVSDKNIVAVPWNHYRSDISGGTGKFAHARGYLDYFGMADFEQSTLVLRYRGQVCHSD